MDVGVVAAMEVKLRTTTGYSGLQIALHWLIAILIVTAWFTGEGAEEAMEVVEDGGVAGFVPHVVVGLSVLALVVVRVLVRLSRGAPAAPGAPGSLSALAADWGHRLIYLLMIAYGALSPVRAEGRIAAPDDEGGIGPSGSRRQEAGLRSLFATEVARPSGRSHPLPSLCAM